MSDDKQGTGSTGAAHARMQDLGWHARHQDLVYGANSFVIHPPSAQNGKIGEKTEMRSLR